MKTLLILLIFSCFSLISIAQKDTSYYNPNIIRKTYYLKALQKINGNYYYGERKLNGYYALEVPFFELNDAEVNYHYKRFKTFTNIGSVISIVPTVYFFTTARNVVFGRYNKKTINNLLIVSLSSLTGSLVCNGIAKSHIKKAATKYNQALGQPKLGYLQLEPDDKSLGMSLKYKF